MNSDVVEMNTDPVDISSDVVEMNADPVGFNSDVVEMNSDPIEINSNAVDINTNLVEINRKLLRSTVILSTSNTSVGSTGYARFNSDAVDSRRRN
jgi:hypothetical protein